MAMENEPTVVQRFAPAPEQIIKWIRYGFGIGLVGVLFAGIICGPVAIYFGVRTRTAAATLNARGYKIKANLIIGLGVFDILFFLIMVIGTIRLTTTGA